MKNKDVGYLVIGLGLVIGYITLSFNSALKDIVEETCVMGLECSMHSTVSFQTNLSLTILALILAIGFYLVFAKEPEKIIIKKVKEKSRSKKLDTKNLDPAEKKVISILKRENGAFFQSSLMEEIGVGKVKMTRMMDKLEAKQIIERKRRGMNNIIVLKN